MGGRRGIGRALWVDGEEGEVVGGWWLMGKEGGFVGCGVVVVVGGLSCTSLELYEEREMGAGESFAGVRIRWRSDVKCLGPRLIVLYSCS